MTQSFETHSKLDDGKQVQIALGNSGVIFRVGKIEHPTMLHENIVVDYDLAEELLWKALVEIKSRNNG